MDMITNRNSGEYGFLFAKFLQSEHSSENRDFLLTLDGLRTHGSVSDKNMQKIYDKYIKSGAKTQVNLPDAMRLQFDRAMKKTPPDYDAARKALPDSAKEVYNLTRDTMSRFKQSYTQVVGATAKAPLTPQRSSIPHVRLSDEDTVAYNLFKMGELSSTDLFDDATPSLDDLLK